MQKTDDTPIWVYLAFSSIETRKSAVLLILSNVIFSAYCVPWISLYPDIPWLSSVFLIEDWEWFIWTAPMNIWYWFSLKWVDKNKRWRIENG